MLRRPYNYRGVPIAYGERNYPYSGRRAPRNFVAFGMTVFLFLLLIGVLVGYLLSGNVRDGGEDTVTEFGTEQPRGETASDRSAGSTEKGSGQQQTTKVVTVPDGIGNVPVVRPKNRTATQVQIYLLARASALERNGRYSDAQRELEKLFRTLSADSALCSEAKELQKRIAEQVLLKNFTFRIHSVQGGESLSVIAKKYKVSVKVIRQANHLRSDRIIKGQKLKIPNSKWKFVVRPVVEVKRLFLYQQTDGSTFLFRVFDLSAEYPGKGKSVYSGNLQEYLSETDWMDYKRYGIPNDIPITNEQ